jgi:hypothetical protein
LLDELLKRSERTLLDRSGKLRRLPSIWN